MRYEVTAGFHKEGWRPIDFVKDGPTAERSAQRKAKRQIALGADVVSITGFDGDDVKTFSQWTRRAEAKKGNGWELLIPLGK